MIKRVVVEVEVGGTLIRKEVNDAWWGSNPIFHAKEFSEVSRKLTSEIDALLAASFGDVRES